MISAKKSKNLDIKSDTMYQMVYSNSNSERKFYPISNIYYILMVDSELRQEFTFLLLKFIFLLLKIIDTIGIIDLLVQIFRIFLKNHFLTF